MYNHINLKVPIRNSYQRDTAVKWFKNVYVGTEIKLDYIHSCLYMYNEENNHELFSMYDPDDWILSNSNALYSLNDSVVFYVRDIQYLDKEAVKTGANVTGDILFYIGLEIGTDYPTLPYNIENEMEKAYNNALYDLYNTKKKYENRLASMYECLESIYERLFAHQTIFDLLLPSIPSIEATGEQILREERLQILAKMFFSLKGWFTFRLVDSLTLRKEMIIEEKYSGDIQLNAEENMLIDELIYDFPREWTIKDTIRWMGDFTKEPPRDEPPRIRLCPKNIDRAVWELMEIPSFRRKIMKPLLQQIPEIRQSCNDKMYLSMILRNLVFAHECGHLVFRNIRGTLEVTQHETLANWFSTLVCGQWGRMFIEELIPLCPEEYQKFLPVPKVQELTGKKYAEYCKSLLELLKEW